MRERRRNVAVINAALPGKKPGFVFLEDNRKYRSMLRTQPKLPRTGDAESRATYCDAQNQEWAPVQAGHGPDGSMLS